MEDESNLKIIDQIQKEVEKDTCASPQACQNIFSNCPPDDKQQLCGMFNYILVKENCVKY